MPGTDISRCVVAIGHEVSFPIDFSTGKHAELYSSPGTVESCSRQLASHLASCHKITKLLVRKQRCWHHMLVKLWCHDPCIYFIRDIAFAHRAKRSDSKQAVSISSCILLQDPGGLMCLFLVHHTCLSLPPILSTRTKGMLWPYLLINRNLFPSSRWMALIIRVGNSKIVKDNLLLLFVF